MRSSASKNRSVHKTASQPKAKAIAKRSRVGTTAKDNYFQSIIEQSSEGFALIDENGAIIEWNQANEIITGLKYSEVLGQAYWDVSMKLTSPERRTAQNRERIKSIVLDALRTGKSTLFDHPIEAEVYTQPGRERHFFHQTIFPIKTENGYRIASLTQDISERKRAEQLQRAADELFNKAFRASPIGINIFRLSDGRSVDANETFLSMIGYSREELIGHTADELHMGIDPQERAVWMETLLAKGSIGDSEMSIVTKSGEIRHFIFSFEKLDMQDQSLAMMLCVDITERQQAKDKLRDSEERYRSLFNVMEEGVAINELVLDKNGDVIDYVILSVNPAFEKQSPYTKEQALGKRATDVYQMTPEYIRGWWKSHSQINAAAHTEMYHEPSDRWFYVATTKPEEKRFATIFTDITARKKVEARLLHINRLYATISQIDQTIVRAQDRGTLFSEICRVAIEHGKFRMAWIGVIDENDEYVKPIAFAGEEQGYLTNISIAINDLKLGGGPTGTAIREGRCIICRDIANDPRMSPWREKALQRGYGSSAAVPIRQKDRLVGALTVYSSEPQGIDDDDEKLLDEIGLDISYALDSMESEDERRLAEKRIHNANLYNRSLIEASLDPLVTIGPDGKITDVNTSTEDITGFKREELIGTDFSDYFTEPDNARSGYQKVFRDGSVRDYPLEIQHRDGHVTSVLYNATIYKDEKGNVVGIFAAARDITERKRAEKALQESEERFRKAIEAAGAVPYLHDYKTNTYTFIGNGIRSLTGYSAQEITPTLYGSLERDARMTGEAAGKSVKEASKLMLAGQLSNWSYDSLVISKDGTKHWIADTSVPVFDETNKVIGSIGFLQNITERKLAEEEIRNANLYNRRLIEASIDPLVTIGPDGKITDVNTSTESITGFKRDELIGTDFSDYFTEPDKARSGYQKVFRDGSVRDYPLEIRHRDGHVTSVLYNATIYKDEKDNVVGVFAAARDTTELKQAEEKLRSTLEEKETLLREVHHRVKNNLQAIIALIDMQAKGMPDEKARQFLKEIEGQARTMSLVYEQLYQSENLSRVEMEPYVQQLTANILQAFGAERKINLKLSAPISLDVADAMPCGLIINELFTNIIKHAFPPDFKNEPAVKIDLHRDGKTCTLVVSDNGIGLPSDQDLRSFRTLGLRLVNLWATHQLGGTLDITSKPGSTFTITFDIQTER